MDIDFKAYTHAKGHFLSKSIQASQNEFMTITKQITMENVP